ncbi:putative chaperone/heat shock protein Hsp12 [Kalaharituber pfeilii]|nr:putative chaperone/heat shock protein Hsp12 [Kalaharituber pfeilii]
MSDTGRKDFSTKAHEKITPDTQKSTYDKTKETVTDTADRVAANTQSDSNKSVTQETFDKSRREKDQQAHGGTGETIVEKVKHTVGLGNK